MAEVTNLQIPVYDGQIMTSQDFALMLDYTVSKRSYLINGFDLTASSGAIKITKGWAVVRGRIVKLIDVYTFSISSSSSTENRYLYLHVNLENSSSPVEIMESTSALSDDTDFNTESDSGNAYLQLASFTVTGSEISNLKKTASASSGGMTVGKTAGNYQFPTNTSNGKHNTGSSNSYWAVGVDNTTLPDSFKNLPAGSYVINMHYSFRATSKEGVYTLGCATTKGATSTTVTNDYICNLRNTSNDDRSSIEIERAQVGTEVSLVSTWMFTSDKEFDFNGYPVISMPSNAWIGPIRASINFHKIADVDEIINDTEYLK